MHQRWDETRIIEGCKNKKRKARKALFDKYHDYLLGVCLHYAKDRHEAESILLEALLKVFNNIHQYKVTGSFIAWMKRIVINTAIDYIRKNKKYSTAISINEYNERDYAAVTMEDNFSVNEILKAVQQLSPGYRLVFNLYVMEGFTHIEISQKLKISVSTSKTQLFKARKHLVEMLREKGIDRIQ